MPERPPFFHQETDYSCVPACLRMVLESLGMSKSEEELRALCDCTALATRAGDAVIAVRELGFTKTRKYNLDVDLLKEQLGLGLYPIAFIGVRITAHSYPETHAVVVVDIAENNVSLLDPLRGEITLAQEAFLNEWNRMRGLTILIE